MRIKILLSEPGRMLIKELHERLAEQGYADIRPAHSQVFQYLSKEGSRITDLAEQAQMTKQSMSILVSDMERQGYLKRYPDQTDKRAFIFKPTAKGEKVYEIAGKIIKDILDSWKERLGAKKMDQLITLLAELNDSIKQA